MSIAAPGTGMATQGDYESVLGDKRPRSSRAGASWGHWRLSVHPKS